MKHRLIGALAVAAMLTGSLAFTGNVASADDHQNPSEISDQDQDDNSGQNEIASVDDPQNKDNNSGQNQGNSGQNQGNSGQTGTEHCPDHAGNPNKVEGANNSLVLDEGTRFCVKGSTGATGILGPADGKTTLLQYLSAYLTVERDVSYYVVYMTPPPPVETEVMNRPGSDGDSDVPPVW